METKINGELVNFFKVRDPEGCESGWAYKDEEGVIRLDNSFRRIPSGSRLELEDDGYTIKSFIDSNEVARQRREREHKAEMARQNKELHKYIGKHVKVRRGVGEILRVEGAWAIAKFGDEDVKYTLAAINDLLKDGRIY